MLTHLKRAGRVTVPIVAPTARDVTQRRDAAPVRRQAAGDRWVAQVEAAPIDRIN